MHIVVTTDFLIRSVTKTIRDNRAKIDFYKGFETINLDWKHVSGDAKDGVWDEEEEAKWDTIELHNEMLYNIF